MMKKPLFVFLLAMMSLFVCACGPNYSDGSRMGVVTKLSHKGLLWKSWEGELNVGGMATDASGHMVLNTWAFNCDERMVPQVQEAMRNGHRVELVYRQWAMSPPTINSDYVVVAVKQPNQ